jgi:hypothetical protein
MKPLMMACLIYFIKNLLSVIQTWKCLTNFTGLGSYDNFAELNRNCGVFKGKVRDMVY